MSRDALVPAALPAGAVHGPAKLSAVDPLVEQIREMVRQRGLRIGEMLPTERQVVRVSERYIARVLA